MHRAGGVYLFGAGNSAQFCVDYCKERNYKITAFIDNNKGKQGTEYLGLPVISYEEFKKNGGGAVLVTVKVGYEGILKQLSECSAAMTFDAWTAVHDIKRYDALYEMLYDDKSKKVLEALLNTRFTGCVDYIAEQFDPLQYFSVPGFYWDSEDVTLVNIGCFVGDTIEEFVDVYKGAFDHIYAFDIGAKQLMAARNTADQLARKWCFDKEKITFEHCGVGKETRKACIKTTDSRHLSSMRVSEEEKGAGGIDSICLDDYFCNTKTTFWIADIEGQEMNMLLGGGRIIKRDKPKMALSAYHRPDDLLNMAETIKKFVPEYKFALRHHSSMATETVLYCWI